MSDSENLTSNQCLVLERLRASRRAMSAYEILDLLRDEGLRAPAQIYRALEKLVSVGLVHRLESLNAFIACAHEHSDGEGQHGGADAVVFAICSACGEVAEYNSSAVSTALHGSLEKDGFLADHMTVEVSGCCEGCRR